MELVEGETIAERLAARGSRLPLHEVLTIARQIAAALEAAHERGVVHRDLKPANVKITPDEKVKVLDFGLAKLQPEGAGEAATAGGDLTNSPTLTLAATQAGVILGTAAYMSPEQAKGRVADKRSDVWAFGCVLYEMLTGKRAFDGEDLSDTLAAVLRSDPDWTALSAEVPAPFALVQGCLKKDEAGDRRHLDRAVLLNARDLSPRRPPLPRRRTGRCVPAPRTSVARRPAFCSSRRLTSASPRVLNPRYCDRRVCARGCENRARQPFARRAPARVRAAKGKQLIGFGRRLRRRETVARAGRRVGDLWSPDGQFIGFFAHGQLRVAQWMVQTVCNRRGGRRLEHGQRHSV